MYNSSNSVKALQEVVLLRIGFNPTRSTSPCYNRTPPPPHHNHFTDLFLGASRWAGARRELLDFMMQGKINRGRHTDHRAGCHSIWTNQLQSYTCMQYTVIHKIYKNESKHSEMGPVRRNPNKRTVRSVHMCVHCTVHNYCTQYCTEQTW